MKKYKTRQARVLVDILCDVCGKSCKNDNYYADDTLLREDADFEYGTVSATWGYFSCKDGESYSTVLCESCFDDVVKHIEALKTQRRESENNARENT
jgi:hypothetical protein